MKLFDLLAIFESLYKNFHKWIIRSLILKQYMEHRETRILSIMNTDLSVSMYYNKKKKGRRKKKWKATDISQTSLFNLIKCFQVCLPKPFRNDRAPYNRNGRKERKEEIRWSFISTISSNFVARIVGYFLSSTGSYAKREKKKS